MFHVEHFFDSTIADKERRATACTLVRDLDLHFAHGGDHRVADRDRLRHDPCILDGRSPVRALLASPTRQSHAVPRADLARAMDRRRIRHRSVPPSAPVAEVVVAWVAAAVRHRVEPLSTARPF